MTDYSIQLRRIFTAHYRDGLKITEAIEAVMPKQTFYDIEEATRQEMDDRIKAEVEAEIAGADAQFVADRARLQAAIMTVSLEGVLAGARRMKAVVENVDSSDFNAIAAARDLADLLRNGIMVPDRKFTPELPKIDAPLGAPQPLLVGPSMIPIPMPDTLGQVKRLTFVMQDGTTGTVERPSIVDQPPAP